MKRSSSYLLLACLMTVAIYLVLVNDTSTHSHKEHVVASDKLTLDQSLKLVQAEIDHFPHLYAGAELEGENILVYATAPALADNSDADLTL